MFPVTTAQLFCKGKTMRMRYMLYICLLVIPIFFFTGCREGERVIEYGQLWNAEFTVKNEASQKVSLILTPYFKSNGRWYAISYHSQDDETIQDSQVEEFKAEEQRTVTFQRMSLFGATKGNLSFLAEVGGQDLHRLGKGGPCGLAATARRTPPAGACARPAWLLPSGK